MHINFDVHVYLSPPYVKTTKVDFPLFHTVTMEILQPIAIEYLITLLRSSGVERTV